MPPPSRQVFLNFPYDTSYTSILHAVVFTLLDCGFIPRCALENMDASDSRLQRIFDLISECPFGIHDISYSHPDPETGLGHFNIAFELGLFLSSKYFGDEDHQVKKCLILDSDPHRYHRSISDISGQDIQAHKDDPGEAIARVRDWLNSMNRNRPLPGAPHIHSRYTAFREQLLLICEEAKLDANALTFKDFAYCARRFIRYFSRNLS